MLSDRRALAALVAAMFVFVACGGNGDGQAGVGVRSINTNIGLGIEIADAAPANIVVGTGAQQPARLEAPSATVPPFAFETPTRVVRPCPEAGPFDFPEVETGVEPRGRPAPGDYDWKLDGTFASAGGEFPIDLFQARTISDVEDVPSIPGAFRYTVHADLVDDRQDRGTLATTYRVVPESPVHTEQTASDAGKGLYIESTTFIEPTGDGETREGSLNFVPAVQLMAFPVIEGAGNGGSTATGQPLGSTGTDPSTGAQLTVRGVVSGKLQVDACGERVDSWLVDGEQIFRFTNQNGQTVTYHTKLNYGVAIQFGSLVVYEYVEVPIDGPVLTLEARIGRVPEATES